MFEEPSIRIELSASEQRTIPCSLFVEVIKEHHKGSFTAWDIKNLGITFWAGVLDGRAPRDNAWAVGHILRKLFDYGYIKKFGKTPMGYNLYSLEERDEVKHGS